MTNVLLFCERRWFANVIMAVARRAGPSGKYIDFKCELGLLCLIVTPLGSEAIRTIQAQIFGL